MGRLGNGCLILPLLPTLLAWDEPLTLPRFPVLHVGGHTRPLRFPSVSRVGFPDKQTLDFSP